PHSRHSAATQCVLQVSITQVPAPRPRRRRATARQPSMTLTLLLVSMLAPQEPTAVSPALQEALRAARFLESAAIKTEAGLTWPADPKDPKSASLDLYGGSAGVVLFFLEAHHLTGRAEFLERARAGADHLLASLDSLTSPEQMGLYTGVAGVGYVLE